MFYLFLNYYYAFLFVFAGKVEGPEGTSDGAVSICQDVDFVLFFFFLHGLLSRFGTDSPFIPPPPVALWVVVFLFRLFCFFFFFDVS